MRSISAHILEYAQSQQFVALVVIALLSFALYLIICCDDGEQAVPIFVPLPDQCKPGWEGETLEHPSLKVFGLRIN